VKQYYLVKNLLLFSLSLFLGAVSSLWAQNTPEHQEETIMQVYAKRREALAVQQELNLVKLKTLYHGALGSLAEEIRVNGDFENFMKVENELKRTGGSLARPDAISDISSVAKLQQILITELDGIDLEHAKELTRLYEQLDVALVQMQQFLLKEGNVQGAKRIQAVRVQQKQDNEVVRAYKIAPLVKENSAASNNQTSNLTLAHVQKMLKGKVTHFNPMNGEVEVVYDFQSDDQLKDFRIQQKNHFKISNGTLEVTTPPGSDWWFAYPELKCPYLVIPYLDAGDKTFSIDLLKLEVGKDYHIAMGMSDLQKRTIGFGPFFQRQGFTAEGWVPGNEQYRGKTAKAPLEFPVTISFAARPKEISFEVKSNNRSYKLEVDTAPDLSFPGLFPKSWGSEGTKAIYDQLTVKGIFKPDFEN
jgi:hypothetical protein